jgi:SAM-dependent methyltransferase
MILPMADTLEPLLIAADALCHDAKFREVIWRHCHGPKGPVESLNTRIHHNDQMLLHSLRHWREVNSSVTQYFSVALQQYYSARQILSLTAHTDLESRDILDFACGFGRLQRFLALGASSSRIWAADIQREAVDFVAEQFGVHGLRSDVDPDRFDPGRHFDFIWVASLFSHLPSRLFDHWLRRLLSLLTADGVLCFSVHDQSLLPNPATIPKEEGGIRFILCSEDSKLDVKTYGTTYVSESYVRRSIKAACGEDRQCWRIPRALGNHQDLYVVPAQSLADPVRLQAFRKGAWGCVDRLRVLHTGELDLCGWAASLDDGALDCVEITVNGEQYKCKTSVRRDDVRTVVGDERLAMSGFEFRTPLDRDNASSFVVVSAKSHCGESALLYAGSVTIPNA